MQRLVLIALTLLMLGTCSRAEPAGSGNAEPDDLTKAEFAEIEQLRAAVRAGNEDLFHAYLSLRGITERWGQCGLPPIDPVPILDGLMARHGTTPPVRAQLTRLNALDARNHRRSLRIWKTMGVTGLMANLECDGWRLDSGREWLAANPPNGWTHASWRSRTPPPDTVLTDAQARQWRDLALNDRYGRRVWSEMELTEVMRARLCSEDAVAGAKARLNHIAGR